MSRPQCSFRWGPAGEGSQCPDPAVVKLWLSFWNEGNAQLSCHNHIVALMYSIASKHEIAKIGTAFMIDPIDWNASWYPVEAS